jgi:hypothetical protein
MSDIHDNERHTDRKDHSAGKKPGNEPGELHQKHEHAHEAQTQLNTIMA